MSREISCGFTNSAIWSCNPWLFCWSSHHPFLNKHTKMSTSTVIPVSKEANKHLSEYDHGWLAGAFVHQSNIARIARDVDLPESTVRSAYKRLQQTQTTLPKTLTGRKRLLSQTDLIVIETSVRRQPTQSIGLNIATFWVLARKVSLSAFWVVWLGLKKG